MKDFSWACLSRSCFTLVLSRPWLPVSCRIKFLNIFLNKFFTMLHISALISIYQTTHTLSSANDLWLPSSLITFSKSHLQDCPMLQPFCGPRLLDLQLTFPVLSIPSMRPLWHDVGPCTIWPGHKYLHSTMSSTSYLCCITVHFPCQHNGLDKISTICLCHFRL